MFIYLFDVPEESGPPHLVSRQLTKDLPSLPHGYARRDRPDLCEAEVSAAGPAGTVVAYSVDTFHRGTNLTAPGGARFTLMTNYRAGPNEWMTRHGWGERSFAAAWTPFAEQASLRQLLLFGFPPPGHPYWTEETLRGMAGRYPGMDLSPWRT
jgi:CubicO group peptidase (beta-lactamase class C family)